MVVRPEATRCLPAVCLGARLCKQRVFVWNGLQKRSPPLSGHKQIANNDKSAYPRQQKQSWHDEVHLLYERQYSALRQMATIWLNYFFITICRSDKEGTKFILLYSSE